jgi:hypothetical protein
LRPKPKPVDQATKAAARRSARRCVEIIETLLRPEEVGEAYREFHLAILHELSTPPNERPKP